MKKAAIILAALAMLTTACNEVGDSPATSQDLSIDISAEDKNEKLIELASNEQIDGTDNSVLRGSDPKADTEGLGAKPEASAILVSSEPSPESNLEAGMNQESLTRIKADISENSALYDRACDDHDEHKSHLLVDPEKRCHYDHQHGDDPNWVNDIFGAPGAWFGDPGKEISYEWQTFPTDDSNAPMPEVSDPSLENNAKHEGYNWIVRRDQPCKPHNTHNLGSEKRGCITDFRLQFHGMFFSHGAAVRWHSASLEARICDQEQRQCGIYRSGGWQDNGSLYSPPNGDDLSCNDTVFPQKGHENRRKFGFTALPADEKFMLTEDTLSNPGFIESDGQIYVGRCHPILSDARIAEGPSTSPRVGKYESEWWLGRDAKMHAMPIVLDPVGNVEIGSDGKLKLDMFCEDEETDCRWNQSITTAEIGYVLQINESYGGTRVDSDGDDVTDVGPGKLYVDRLGDPRPSGACSEPGLDCVPWIMDGIPLELGEPHWGRYNHSPCHHPIWSNAELAAFDCEYTNYDLTPSGQASWITWFHRYGSHN